MSKQCGLSSNARLFSTSGTFGSVDFVATYRGVLVSLTGRNYDTLGYLHRDSALADLSINDAVHLSQLLNEAVQAAQDAERIRSGR